MFRTMTHSKLSANVPSRLFIGPTYCRALGALWHAVNDISGLSLLTGDEGTGKTTLVTSLLKDRDKSFRVAYITDYTLGVDQILAAIVRQLRIVPTRTDRIGLVQALNTFAGNLPSGGRVILIFDNAHALSEEAFEEIRGLRAARKPGMGLQIILVGQPVLAQRLREPKYSALDQLIGTRAELHPLATPEVHDYVRYLMDGYSGSHPTWSYGGLNFVAWFSMGVPRMVERLCRGSLVLAESEAVPLVMPRHVRVIAAEDGLPEPGTERPDSSIRISEMVHLTAYWIRGGRRTAIVTSLAAAMIALAVFTVFTNIRKVSSRMPYLFLGQDFIVRQSKASSNTRSRHLGHQDAPGSALLRHQPNRAFHIFASRVVRVETDLASLGERNSSQHVPNPAFTISPRVTKGIGVTVTRWEVVKSSKPRHLGAAPSTLNHAKTGFNAQTASLRRHSLAGRLGGDGRSVDTSKIDVEPTSNIDLMSEEVNRGDAAMAEGNYSSALSNYKTAFRLDPNKNEIFRRIEGAYRAKAAEAEILQ